MEEVAKIIFDARVMVNVEVIDTIVNSTEVVTNIIITEADSTIGCSPFGAAKVLYCFKAKFHAHMGLIKLEPQQRWVYLQQVR